MKPRTASALLFVTSHPPSDIQLPLADIERARRVLAEGGVVGMPTETVYGLAADALQADAVRRVFALKQRPATHPVIVHIADATALEQLAIDIPRAAYDLAAAFWPGPLTLILRRGPRVPDVVTGGYDTVGIRVPQHPVARELLLQFSREHSGALAAPSANRFGRVSPTTAEHVRQEFGEQLDVVLDGGPCTVGIESTIVDLSSPSISVLRPGHIEREQLERVLGRPIDEPTRPTVAAPGTLASHYAPSTPVELFDRHELARVLDRCPGPVAIFVRRGSPIAARAADEVFPMPAAPDAYARELYARLRRADTGGFTKILIERPNLTHPGWHAVADRLRRAATPAD